MSEDPKPWIAQAEQVHREIEDLVARSHYVVAEGDGYRRATYERAGQPDYETYRQVQNIGNRLKLGNVYARPWVIDALAQHATRHLGSVRSVLCHGTRNGAEIGWLAERLPDAEVLGTDIADSAATFPKTIQWDFHDFREDWRDNWDVIYTNSWDHALEPERAFLSWAQSLRPGGVLYIEHGPGHEDVDMLDLFGASQDAVTNMVLRGSAGRLKALPRLRVADKDGDRYLLPFARRRAVVSPFVHRLNQIASLVAGRPDSTPVALPSQTEPPIPSTPGPAPIREISGSMKVRIVVGHLEPTLIREQREVSFVQRLQQCGHDAMIYRGCPIGTARGASDWGGTFQAFDIDDSGHDPKKSVSSALVSQIAADRPDILFVYGFDYQLVKSAVAAVSKDTPVIAIVGGTAYEPDPIVGRIDYILEEYDGQTAPFLEHFSRCRGRAVLPKYVDWKVIEDLPPVEPAYDIITVGDFTQRRKNQEMLLPLLDAYRVCFVGDGPRLQPIQALAEGSGRRTEFTGRLGRHDVLAALSKSRLMVHPSVWEGFPRAIAEGLAMGLPVVAHQRAFPHLPKAEWGVLCSDASMYGEIDRLLADEPLRLAASAAARNYARAHFSDERRFDIYAAAITAVTGAKISATPAGLAV